MLNGEFKKGNVVLEKNMISLANLVPVPNRALEFKFNPKTLKERVIVPIFLMNQK